MKNRLAQKLLRLLRVLAMSLVAASVPDARVCPARRTTSWTRFSAIAQRASRGCSRVIVEFICEPDVARDHDARHAAGRRLPASATRSREVANTSLAALARRSARVARLGRPSGVRRRWSGRATPSAPRWRATPFGVTGTRHRRRDHRFRHHRVPQRPLRRPQQQRRHSASCTSRTSRAILNGRNVDQPTDDYGHGTHVAGIIAGTGVRLRRPPHRHRAGRKSDRPEGARRRRRGLHQRRHRRDRLRHRRQGAVQHPRHQPVGGRGVFESYTTDPLTLAAQARAWTPGIVVVASAGNLGRERRRRDAVRRHHRARQRALGPHRRRQRATGHRAPQRRHDRAVQLARSDVDRLRRQAGLARPGRRHRVAAPTRRARCTALLSDYLLNGTQHTPYKPYLSLSGTSMAAPVVGRRRGADARGESRRSRRTP